MEKNQQAVAVFDKLATLYQSKFMQLEQFEDSFDLFCNSISVQYATILELACGPGNITRYLLKLRPDFQVLGTDLSPNMIALAKLNNPTATFELLDCRLLHQLNQQFDGIVLGFGLPYLNKEETISFIAAAANRLAPNGVLYMSTMEAAYSTSHFKTGSSGDAIFTHYYEATFLKRVLISNGFCILNELRKNYLEADGSITIDLVIIARLQSITDAHYNTKD